MFPEEAHLGRRGSPQCRSQTWLVQVLALATRFPRQAFLISSAEGMIPVLSSFLGAQSSFRVCLGGRWGLGHG